MTNTDMLHRCIKMLKSCKTAEQFKVACTYCDLAEKHYLTLVDIAVVRSVALMIHYYKLGEQHGS